MTTRYRIECRRESLIQIGSKRLAEDCAELMAYRNFGDIVRTWDSVPTGWRLQGQYRAEEVQ